MRVLYGVAGQGLGHATRSLVSIQHLRSRGHTVMVVASKQAVPCLRANLPNVTEIIGLRVRYEHGAMDLAGTLAMDLAALPSMGRNAAAWRDAEVFDPQACLSDFESFPVLFASAHGLPCASIDNHHVITRYAHPADVTRGDAIDYALMRGFVSVVSPGCARYIVTSFFDAPTRPECSVDTVTVPPILRPAALAARPTYGEHVLVYRTDGDERSLDALHALAPRKFVVYGMGVGDAIDENCVLRAPSETRFLADIASARAVVATAGSSLLGECVALGKPVYAVPIQRQFEQILNARYIERLGYGVARDSFDAGTLREFLDDAAGYAACLRAQARHDGNAALYRELDALFG